MIKPRNICCAVLVVIAMKKTIIAISLAAFVFLFQAVYAQFFISPDNLIRNSSIEDQIDGIPKGWFSDASGENGTSFQYPAPGRTGKGVQTTVDSYTNGDAKWLWEPVRVEENGDYEFSEYYKSNAKTMLIVSFRMEDGSQESTNLVALPPADNWTKVEKTFNIRPRAVSATVMHVLQSTGTLAIDDVSLVKVQDEKFSEGLVSLSFDDGGESFYTDVFPELLSRNLKATVNVVNNFIGKPGYMSVQQIKEINQNGMEIGSHSFSHSYLTRLPDDVLGRESRDSKKAGISLGLSPLTTFAYPYGDYDDRAREAVIKAGYKAARITGRGFNTKNSDLYTLRTQNVTGETSVEEVKQWIDDAIKNKTWLILGFHDVTEGEGDEYAIAPENLEAILDYLTQTKVKVLTTDYVVGNLMKK